MNHGLVMKRSGGVDHRASRPRNRCSRGTLFCRTACAGKCHIWVGTASNSDELKVNHDWQQRALHTANIRGLSDGRLFDRSGRELTKGVIGDLVPALVLSIKLRGRDYEDAWEALNNYVKQIYSLFLGRSASSGEEAPRLIRSMCLVTNCQKQWSGGVW